MKLFHPQVIHHLTIAYYISLYPTYLFNCTSRTCLWWYGMPYGCSHCRSCPLYILRSRSDQVFLSEVLGMTVKLGCKQWDFCYGCCVSHMDGSTVVTWISDVCFINHLETCEPTFHGSLCSHDSTAQSMRLNFSLDTTYRMLKGQLAKFVRDMQPFGKK